MKKLTKGNSFMEVMLRVEKKFIQHNREIDIELNKGKSIRVQPTKNKTIKKTNTVVNGYDRNKVSEFRKKIGKAFNNLNLFKSGPGNVSKPKIKSGYNPARVKVERAKKGKKTPKYTQ